MRMSHIYAPLMLMELLGSRCWERCLPATASPPKATNYSLIFDDDLQRCAAGASMPSARNEARRCSPAAAATAPRSAAQGGSDAISNLKASDALRRSDQNGKVAATSERRISRVSGSMGEGSKPMWM